MQPVSSGRYRRSFQKRTDTGDRVGSRRLRGVLLRDGAGAYVVIGIAAFVIGVSVTVLCIRLKNRSTNRTDSTEEREH